MRKSIPAFIFGLIGGILGILGGLCDSACAAVESGVTTGSTDAGYIPLILVVGGSIIGLIGACLCFKKANTGGIMELAAAVMIAISAFAVGGATTLSVVALVLFALGGILAMISKKA